MWKYAEQDSLDSKRTKHEGSIEFKARKRASVGKHASATGEECGDSGLYTMNAANFSDAGILRNASNPNDSLATLKRYFGADKSSGLEYIAKSGDSFWLEFDGHDAVIELAPGRYVLRQAGAQKDKTEKFELKWDKADGSCDPANNFIWSQSDPATWSLPSTLVILVPHDRTKKVWGRSQEDDRSNRTYACKPVIHSEPLRISYVPIG